MNNEQLENWIDKNASYARNFCSADQVILVSDLRAFMEGKRIVEDVPVAYRWYTPRSGMWDEHITPGKPPMSRAHMIQPLYAPTEANNGK